MAIRNPDGSYTISQKEMQEARYLQDETLNPVLRAGAGILEGRATDDYGRELKDIGEYVAGSADPFAAHRPYFAKSIRDLYRNPSSFVPTDPSAQYVMQQALQAVNRENAAAGNFFSGNRAIALQDRAADVAAMTYDKEMERRMRMAGAYADPATAALAASKYFDTAAQAPLSSQAAYSYGIGGLISDWLKGGSGSVPAEQGIGSWMNGLFSGGGLDGQGRRGFIGDLGGMFTGSYGAEPTYYQAPNEGGFYDYTVGSNDDPFMYTG